MKNERQDAEATLNRLLAETPVEPSGDLPARVLAELAAGDRRIARLFRETSAVPAPDFAEKTLAALRAAKAESAGNTIPFRGARRFFAGTRFFRAAALAASLALVCGVAFRFGGNASGGALEERLARTLAGDPELYALAQAEDETPSFDELLEASRILSNIDPNVLEIFAYND
ncbi:MAG: hypothetical protein ACI4QA_03035 [Candidatus Spyradosoma sp.]